MIEMMVLSQSLSPHYTSSQSNHLVELHHSSLPSSYLVVSAISKCRNFACKSLYLRVRPGDDDDDDGDDDDDIYDDDDIHDDDDTVFMIVVMMMMMRYVKCRAKSYATSASILHPPPQHHHSSPFTSIVLC